MKEVPKGWKNVNVTPVPRKEHPGNYRLVSLMSVPGKPKEQILLEAISRHMKYIKAFGISQHGFTKGKSFLNSLIA